MVVYLGKATPASGQGGGSGEAVWGDITGTLADQTDLAEALAAKQDTLTAGTGIDITNDVISVTGGGSTPESIIDARTETAIRLWTGNQTQYNNGESTTYYNWQSSGGLAIVDISATGLHSITYGDGIYVAVDESGNIHYSTDKQNWANISLGVTFTNPFVEYGNGNFVVYDCGNYANVGVSTSFYVASSSDITTWTTATAPANIKGMVYGNNIWMMTSTDKKVYTSSDLSTFTAVYTNAKDFMGNIGYTNNKFLIQELASGSGSSTEGQLKISNDNGITWNNEGSTWSFYRNRDAFIKGVNGIFYIDNKLDGSYSTKATTGNGTLSDVNLRGSSIVYDGSQFVSLYNGYYDTSSDGITFTNDSQYLGSGVTFATFGDSFVGITSSFDRIAYYGASSSVYTTDENPTTESTVYSAPSTPSALTITAVGTGTITLSDTNTYDYNASGNQTVTQTVGQAHPDWLCFIEGVGIKMGNVSFIPTITVDQTYNASSTNAQSGVAVASGISDTLGTIETALAGV